MCMEAWGLEITCSAQPSHAGGNGDWIVPILQMENVRHWSLLFSPTEKEERRNPIMNLAQYLASHGGCLGVPFSFSVSHSHELTAQEGMLLPPSGVAAVICNFSL